MTTRNRNRKAVLTIGLVLGAASAFAAIRAVSHDMYGGNANSWQVKRHAEKMTVVTNGGAKVVFIGDSITHFWESAGKAQLEKYYSEGDMKMLDLGISGDRTEHVLWRIDEGGELDGYEAKCILLMIGTNNTGRERAKDTAEGIKKILELIAIKQPQAKTLLVPVFMRGDSNDKNRAVNEQVNEIIKGYADGQKVIWVDFNSKFLDENGDTKWIMPDRLHPNAQGYAEIWMPAVLPYFKEICGK